MYLKNRIILSICVERRKDGLGEAVCPKKRKKKVRGCKPEIMIEWITEQI